MAPQVTRLSPEELTAVLDDAMNSVNNGDLTSAEEQYKEVVLQAVTDDETTRRIVAEARYNLGVIAEWQGAYDDAKRHYEAALTLEKELGAAVVAIGRIILRTQDESAALNYAKGRLSSQTDSLQLRNALNRIRVAANREWESVEQDSKQILRIEEKNVDAMVNLAVSYAQSGRHELAISVLNGAKAIDGSDPEIYLRLALSNLALDGKLNARLALEEAVGLPQGASAEVYNNLGVIYHVAGDFSGAEIQFRKALARWPDMLAAHINLSNALKAQQRFLDAKASLEKAQNLAPQNATVSYNLGILLLDGQFPAIEDIQRFKLSISHMEDYKGRVSSLSDDDPVHAYIGEAKKRIKLAEDAAKEAAQEAKEPEDDFGDEDDADEDSGTDETEAPPEPSDSSTESNDASDGDPVSDASQGDDPSSNDDQPTDGDDTGGENP